MGSLQLLILRKFAQLLIFGPGYGFLLRLLREKHPDLEITAVDPDIGSLSYLEKYRINIVDLMADTESNSVEEKFDLILSAHSLEHMSDPNMFFERAQKSLSDDGKMFIDVPNCPFTIDEYLKRPYDGPHLLFFTEQSLIYYFQKWGFTVDHITTAHSEFEKSFLKMKNQYRRYNREFGIGGQLLNFGKSKLGYLVPEAIKRAIKAFISSGDVEIDPYEYGGKRWTIRCIVSKST